MEIRTSADTDISAILHLHTRAFGDRQGAEISHLVKNLFLDITAKPRYSFVAVDNKTVIGHILFTRVHVNNAGKKFSAQLLAPLAVSPAHQRKGVGSQLITAGLQELQKAGVQLVFVLGHPDYYPRCGFTPAGELGFDAPYIIPEEHSDAWMVQELCPGILGTIHGRVLCSDALDKPEYWRE